MKKFTIVTDVHRGALQKIEFPYSDLIKYDNPILLGDNFDIKRALKKDIVALQKMIDLIKSLNIPYVCSNHEGEQGLPQIHIDCKTSTLFTHGHLCKSNADKYIKDCKTKWEGSSYLMHVITGLSSKMIHIIPFGKEDAIRASNLAKMHDCKNIVMGHYHCQYDENVNGVRVIVCPRGVTEIEL